MYKTKTSKREEFILQHIIAIEAKLDNLEKLVNELI